MTDEAGAAPNGVDGTADPSDPTHVIGGACPEDMTNICTPGQWQCLNADVQCVGVDAGTFESCDCQDNDCNGVTDNQNPPNGPLLCSPGKDCVNANGQCQCAKPCGGEFCPAGQTCQEVFSSETGQPLGEYCVSDNCGNCAAQTVMDGSTTLCAPAGTVLEDCFEPPVCTCKNQNGCQAPCFGVTCTSPEVCSNYGPNAGQCVSPNCFNLGCPGCGTACGDSGECVPNPCTEDSCPAGQVCKPSDDFLTFECLPSCATVMCNGGEVCVDGVCVPSCDPPCQQGEVCDLSQTPPTCVTDLCPQDFCADGSCCDDITGECGACPCEGVICPDGQVCDADTGECILGSMGEGGGSSVASSAAATGSAAASGAGTGGGNGEGAADANGVWGLATGGGGCACEAAGTSSRPDGTALLALGLAVAGLRKKRRRLADRASKGAAEGSR